MEIDDLEFNSMMDNCIPFTISSNSVPNTIFNPLNYGFKNTSYNVNNYTKILGNKIYYLKLVSKVGTYPSEYKWIFYMISNNNKIFEDKFEDGDSVLLHLRKFLRKYIINDLLAED